MSLLPSVNNSSVGEPYFIPIDGAVNPFPIPGPAGSQGIQGVQGVQGEPGINSFGSWYYATGVLPPAPQTVQWNATDIYFSLVSIPPGGSEYLYSLKTQFQSTGAVTLYINSTDVGGADIGFTAAVTAIAFNEPLGYAQFTYTLIGPMPLGFVIGNVVRVFDGGGTVGPAGPPGPAGSPGTAATVTIGTTNTLSPGSAATVVNVGTPTAAILNFGIPEGQQGSPANAATWSQYPATQAVNIQNNNITNVNTLNSGTLGATNIDCYQSAITGFGTLQVGSPIPLAPNPGSLLVNGTAEVVRGNSAVYMNAGGLIMLGDTPVPNIEGIRFNTLKVGGIYTSRFEMNTVSSPAGAITMTSPSYITADAIGAVNLTGGGAALLQGGLTTTIESAAKDIRLQGTGGSYSDVTMYGGTLGGMGNITGQAGSGVAIGNVNSVSGVGAASIAVTSNIDLSNNTIRPRAIVDVSGSTGTANQVLSAGTGGNSLRWVTPAANFRDTTEFFVSNNGNDVTGDGSINNPYATIQKAITQAELISSAALICVINVASGHYTENLTFTKGYIMLNGVLSTQTANEVTEITGSITISCAGAADLFNRQVVFQGFNITCGVGQTITDNSTTSHSVAFQDCKIFTNGRTFNGISTGADARTYFTNCDISQTNAATTDPTIYVGLGAVEMERVDITTDGNCPSLEIGGTALLQRLTLCTLENTANTTAPICRISSTNTGIQSIGQNAFNYSNTTLKGAGAAGIFISSGVGTTIVLIGNTFTLAGTSSSVHFVVGYNGVGTPVVSGINNTCPYIPPLTNYANSIQTGITKLRWWDVSPMNSGAWSSTIAQANTSPGAQIQCTVNTTESPAGQGGITLLANNFYPTNTGTYQLTYTATFANTGADADVYLWAALNGTRIGRSAGRQTVANNHQETITKTITFNCTAGQFFSFYWLSSSGTVTLATTAAGGAGLQPATPSFYASIVQVA